MESLSFIEGALDAIRKALVGIDGPIGSALRDQFGLKSTADRDKPAIQPMSPAARMSGVIRAGELLRSGLSDLPRTELADTLARYSAVVGEPPSHPQVAADLCRHLQAIPHEDVPALIKAFELIQGRDWSAWCAYYVWNESLATEFLAGSRAGRPVYLDVESSTLDRLGASIGTPLGIVPADATRAFVRSVLRTLSLRNAGPPMLDQHVRAARTWAAALKRDADSPAKDEPPPFVGALAVMALAAEQMRAGDGMRQTNYYGRLCEILDVPEDSRAKVQSDFRKHSHQLWGHLNAWLHAAHGARGIPTAEAFDYRVHVGLPISQALVRAADRDRLPEFFFSYQFSPYQQFSRADMRDVLAGWLPGSSVSGTLKAAWSSGSEAQRRIADVVCIELEHWDGAPPEASIGTRREFPARLLATFYLVPVPEFSATVGVLNEDQVPAGSYRFADGIMPVGVRSLVTATNEYGGFLRLDVDQDAGANGGLLAVALRAGLRLNHERRLIGISRPMRPLVVMLMDESRDLFVEAAHAELGRDHLLLVRDDLVGATRAALDSIARPGFGVLAEARGIPKGWTLFHDVQIRRLLGVGGPLEPLTPRSRAQVEFVGGMKLPDGRWHSISPPTILAIDGTGRDFSLSLYDESGADPESSETVFGTYAGEALVALDGRALPDGNYRVVLNEVSGGRIGAHLTSRALKLRSADSSHLDPPNGTLLAHGGDSMFATWAALSATPAEAPATLALRGVVFESSLPLDAIQAPLMTLPGSFTSTPIRDVEELFGRLPTADRQALEEAFEQLLQQGLVLVEGGKPRLTEAGERWWQSRSVRETRAPRSDYSREDREIVQRFEADLDVILDAAVAVGGGTWSTLEQLIRHSSRERWEPAEAVRNLAALGYLDLELDPRTLRVRRWSVSPSALLMLSDDRGAVLAGARTRRLLESLEREASERGASVEKDARSGRPATVRVRGMDANELRELASTLRIGWTECASLRIAERLPSIRTIYGERPELRVPTGAAIRVFDFDANTWREADGIRLAGAYRVETDVIRFGVLADDGLRECDSAVAKYAAAAATGRHIMAYNSADRSLTCLLGARLPGLFERAVVLSAGELPRALSNGTSVYEAVSPELASWLVCRLGPNAWRT